MLAIFHKQASNNENTAFEVTEKKLETLGIKKSALPFLENDQSEEFNSRKAQNSGLKIRSLENTLLDFSNQAMPLGLPEKYVSLIKNILE